MDRDAALRLMQENTESPSLRQHMLAVEAALRAYALKYGEDPEGWGLVGLLHDFDYERYTNAARSPSENDCPSPVVPKGARPSMPWARSHRAWLTKRA